MENYIVINGKKAELTDEQLEKLGIKPEKKNKYEGIFELCPSTTISDFDRHYFINENGTVTLSMHSPYVHYRAGNYCKNIDIMEQRALHETLNRLLWRASVLAGELDNEWNMNNAHYYIYRDFDSDCLRVDYNDSLKNQGTCYFPTEDSAYDALGNIVIPFLNEHPDFKW